MKHFFIVACILLGMVFGSGGCAHTTKTEATQTDQSDPSREINTELKDHIKKHQGRFAYGAYMNNQKIGWMLVELTMDTFQGEPAAIIVNESQMGIELNGESLTMSSVSRSVYSLRGDGQLLYESVRDVQVDDVSVTEAWPEGQELVISTTLNGHEREDRVPLPLDSLLHSMTFDKWLMASRKHGDRFVLIESDLGRAGRNFSDINIRTAYEFDGEEVVIVEGKEVSARRFKAKGTDGAVYTDRFLPNAVLWERVEGAMRIQLENEETYKQFEVAAFDRLQTISVDAKMGPPQLIQSLTVRLVNDIPFELPESYRQQIVERTEKEMVLNLLPGRKTQENQPLSKEEHKRYTEPTPFIQSKDPYIVTLAEHIVDGETDLLQKVDQLQNWVFNAISPSLSSETASARNVLYNGSGDCTEMALLFITFARAVGIPAREVTGLAYTDEGNLFGWHAWAEIHDGTQWIEVDPSWDELFINPTHIRISKGDDEDSALMQLINLNIVVESFTLK